jgi:hypothetical protein
MNQYGYYNAQLNNAISANLAAVEIYNKHRIFYRNKCFVVLLINSWELMLKAIISKIKISIYERKEAQSTSKNFNIMASY